MKSHPLPIIAIEADHRGPLKFEHLQTEAASLEFGTHTVRHMNQNFAVLCETAGDIAGKATGGRSGFMAQIMRLQDHGFCRLLIVGSRREIERGDYRSKAEPRAVLATLAMIETRWRVPVVFEPCPQRAALLVEQWAFWHWRDIAFPFVGKIKTPHWAV